MVTNVLSFGTGGPLVFAQQASEQKILHWLLWFGVILAILAVAAFVLAGVRRKLFKDHSDTHGPFTLEQIRTLRSQGRLTDTEFETLKRNVVERWKT